MIIYSSCTSADLANVFSLLSFVSNPPSFPPLLPPLSPLPPPPRSWLSLPQFLSSFPHPWCKITMIPIKNRKRIFERELSFLEGKYVENGISTSHHVMLWWFFANICFVLFFDFCFLCDVSSIFNFSLHNCYSLTLLTSSSRIHVISALSAPYQRTFLTTKRSFMNENF